MKFNLFLRVTCLYLTELSFLFLGTMDRNDLLEVDAMAPMLMLHLSVYTLLVFRHEIQIS